MKLFNVCKPCCDEIPYAYYWFITSTSNLQSQFDFEDCDIWCDSPAAVEAGDPEYEGVQLRGNIYSGGMNFMFRNSPVQQTSTVTCVSVTTWGWRMEMIGDGPVFEWRMTPYLYDIESADYTWNPYGFGPYVAEGTIGDLNATFVDGSWQGGIFLQNQGSGSCANNVRNELLLVNGLQASSYLTISGIGPLGP